MAMGQHPRPRANRQQAKFGNSIETSIWTHGVHPHWLEHVVESRVDPPPPLAEERRERARHDRVARRLRHEAEPHVGEVPREKRRKHAVLPRVVQVLVVQRPDIVGGVALAEGSRR